MVTDAPALRPALGSGELFQHLRDGAPRTRAELAAVTGLARATVASRIDSLMSAGLVAPFGDAASTGGRPPSQFALNRAGRIIVAADLGASHSSIALCDLLGRPLEEELAEIRIADGPESILGHLAEVVMRLLAKANRSTDDVLALGMGLPGPVEFATGRPNNPPIMPGWDGFDVPHFLRERIPVPILVDNDVNLMAVGERALHYPGVDDLIFVKVATGLGAGVISSGTLQRGSRGIAGEIGHIRLARDGASLGAHAAGSFLAASLREQGLDTHSIPDVLHAVRESNPIALRTLRQAGRDIGEVLTACISFINPEVIVIGGSMAEAGDHLLAGVREVVYARSEPLATQNLVIAQSRAGSAAGVAGAAQLAIQHALSPEGLERIIR
ncbi:ROK family transcriptional regulator [Naasia aerilata]|uniref:Sugar kinase n=1 Tax=Naasia aerilata TaxID=1162966 RepID=A0ABM8GD28_9MICO|nr:ROK family protein [Naasia aerilata]BDZ46170.1 sugar kinase [Naasia aerilata]